MTIASVDINGGAIDGVTIGANSAGAGTFTTVTASGAVVINGGLTMDTNKFTVADTSGNTAIAGTLDVTGQTTVANFTATGTTVLPATSFGDANITNVGDIALDSISADGSTITITGNTTFADGSYNFDIASHDGTNGLALGGTVVTASAAELNILDGVTATTAEINILDGDTSATSTTVADADRVVLNDNGTMVQVAVTDLAAYFDDEITAMPNLVTTAATTVGALNSGSITSGFGTIDTGSSTITTTGNITGGNLIISDGGNIGSSSDTDAISIASSGNVTMTQDLTVTGNLTVNGSTSTISSTNTTIEDALIELGTGTTGTPSNDAGIVIERGSADNAFIGYDESADKFIVGTGSFTGASTGNLTITTGTLVANVEGNVTGNVTGSSGSTTGNAATATALETARTIGGVSFDGTASINLPGVNTTGDQDTTGNAAGLTSMNTTVTELNVMDGDTSATSTTLADADRVVVNDAGTMKQVALTDFETYFEGALDTLSNVTTVGALNAGSITSGFGAIDNGSSNITTSGTIQFGSLSDGTVSVTDIADEDDFSSNSATKLATQQSIKAYVDSTAGQANNVTGLTATGTELNTVADASGVSIDTSTAVAANDALLLYDNSGSSIGYFDVDLLDTYFSATTKTLTNKTLTSPTVSGLYLSDAGLTIEGSSANDFETVLNVTDPTADRTITLPDATGTVALTTGTAFTGDVNFGDNDKAIFGAGSDLQIYHQGSASYIDDQGTGSLNIRGTNLFLRDASDNLMAGGIAGAEFRLYHNANLKLATTSTGIDVTGSVTADVLIVDADNTNAPQVVFENSHSVTTDAAISTYDDTSGVALALGSNYYLNSAGSEARFNTSEESAGIFIDRTGVITLKTDNSGSAVAKSRLNIAGNGDISFYEDTGTTAKLFWDASAESLGIGTSSPSSYYSTDLVIAAPDEGGVTLVSDTTHTAYLMFADGTSGADRYRGQLSYDHNVNEMAFATNGSEAMRIDSSGNLLVGKTATGTATVGVENRGDGLIIGTRASDVVSILRRNTSDGEVLRFQKDGTTVGSIDTFGGDLTIGTGDTRIRFEDGIDAITPRTTGDSARDGAIDIGYSTVRFKDLYLSGSAYVGDKVIHDGDTDTYLGFSTNAVNVFTGNTFAQFTSSGLFLNDGSLAEDYDALSGTTPTCNVDNGGMFSLTMTGNTTFTFSGALSGYVQGFVLQLTGNGSTVTYPASVDWAGGTAPDAPASGETDILVFITRDGGTTWYGALAIDAAG